jgi:hypothetical protein
MQTSSIELYDMLIDRMIWVDFKKLMNKVELNYEIDILVEGNHVIRKIEV